MFFSKKHPLPIIANPRSGWGLGRRVLRQTLSVLKREDIPFEIFESRKPGEGRFLASRIESQGTAETVVVVGGDGTVHEVANGLLESCLPAKPNLAIIPAGSSNDIAKSLALPHNIRETIMGIKNRQTKLLDIGEVNGRYFIMASALGLFAEAAKHSMSLKGIYGTFRYRLGALWAIGQLKSGWLMKIKTDMETFEGHFGVLMLGNLPRFGGLTLMPEASPQDGLLNGLLIEMMGRCDALRLFFRMTRGHRPDEPRIKTFQTRGLTLDWAGGLLNTDGEIFESQDRTLTWTIHRRAIGIHC